MKKGLKSLLFATLIASSFGLNACGKTKTSSSTQNTSDSGQNTSSSGQNTSSSGGGDIPIEAVAADGTFSYVADSYAERNEILGAMEKYTVDNFLGGLTLFNNGGYVMYSDRVVKGADTYIPGYGFGILSEGEITSDMAAESNTAWKRYYHTFLATDIKTANYMDSTSSTAGTLISYVANSYWDNKMNATKNGYTWIKGLAKDDRPIPQNADANGLATKYKFEVKVGSEMVYNTLTTDSALTKYAGREVQIDDYLVPYKELYMQKNGLTRGLEDPLSGAGSIKGLKNYRTQTANGFNQTAWDNVGIKATTSGGKAYLEFEFNIKCNPFYAMYYLTTSLFAPIPQQFVTDIGGMKNYGTFVNGTSRTPVDTTLSTYAYVLERWNEDQQIVFKHNDKFVHEANTYKIAGIHYRILGAQNSDPEAAFKEFTKVGGGTLDAVSIPKTRLSEYKSDPKTTMTVGSANWKLNLNTSTSERWAELFGVNGSIKKTQVNDYWNVKPIMSNKDFLRGLNASINRKELAETNGFTASSDYFADTYMTDPEEGISYNSTEEHKNNVKSFIPEGDGIDKYGYSLELAKYYFKKAAEDLVAQGKYATGSTVEVELCWMSAADKTTFASVKNYFETAFNNSGAPLTLRVNDVSVATANDIYYKKMFVGQYDMAMGHISGNSLNPLNGMDILKSDGTTGFTLNWGVDTSKVDPTLVYDGKYWSFDALWAAADQGAVVKNGELVPAYKAELLSEVKNPDGTVTVTFSSSTFDRMNIDHNIANSEVAAVVFFWFSKSDYSDYDEVEVPFTFNSADGTITATISAAQATNAKSFTTVGYDIYFAVNVFGNESEQLLSFYTNIYA